MGSIKFAVDEFASHKHTVSDIGIGKITFVETRTPKITSRNFCKRKINFFEVRTAKIQIIKMLILGITLD